MCDFKVGDKVVCVDARSVIDVNLAPIDPLEAGRVYRVRDVYFRERIGAACVLLDGRPNWSLGRDVGYRATRFRKVQRRNIQEWLSQSVKNTDKLDKRVKEGAK